MLYRLRDYRELMHTNVCQVTLGCISILFFADVLFALGITLQQALQLVGDTGVVVVNIHVIVNVLKSVAGSLP